MSVINCENWALLHISFLFTYSDSVFFFKLHVLKLSHSTWIFYSLSFFSFVFLFVFKITIVIKLFEKYFQYSKLPQIQNKLIQYLIKNIYNNTSTWNVLVGGMHCHYDNRDKITFTQKKLNNNESVVKIGCRDLCL